MKENKDITLSDFFNGEARDYIKRRMLDSDAGITETGYDIFGTELETASATISFAYFLYKIYFRAAVHGMENLPVDGPGLIVSNHAPILPFDAAMIFTAALVESEKPRFVRTIINRTISSIPFASTVIARSGQIIGCDENVKRVLENNNLMLVFPTGAEGDVHTIFNKYQLDEFTVGFMEHALKHRVPIIPTCVTGSEEAAMTIGKIDTEFLGFKHLPITPIFPWLGLLGLIPFPTKFEIHFEKPIDYYTQHAKDVDNPDVIRELVEDLRSKIQEMLTTALSG